MLIYTICYCMHLNSIFKPDTCGWRLQPRVPGFLKSFLFACQYVCLSVYPHPRALIISGLIWCDIGHVWLGKPVLQLFSLFLLINWMGMALVTQHVVHTWQRCQSWCCTIHRRRRINYLAVATRQSTSFIKVSGQMHSNEFKRRLGFNFTIIVLA